MRNIALWIIGVFVVTNFSSQTAGFVGFKAEAYAGPFNWAHYFARLRLDDIIGEDNLELDKAIEIKRTPQIGINADWFLNDEYEDGTYFSLGFDMRFLKFNYNEKFELDGQQYDESLRGVMVGFLPTLSYSTLVAEKLEVGATVGLGMRFYKLERSSGDGFSPVFSRNIFTLPIALKGTLNARYSFLPSTFIQARAGFGQGGILSIGLGRVFRVR